MRLLKNGGTSAENNVFFGLVLYGITKKAQIPTVKTSGQDQKIAE